MIYTRKVFAANESKIFFFFVIFFFLFKYYLLSYYRPGDDEMAKRNTLKTTALLLSGGKINKPYVAEPVCTDIENVLYDEEILHRKLSPLKPANVKARKGAGQHA